MGIDTILQPDSAVCVGARTCNRRIVESFSRAQPARSLSGAIGMQALKYRVAIGLALGAAIVGLSACNSEQRREEHAVGEFHQRLEQGRADLIYANSSAFLRAQFSEAQFKQFLSETGVLGRLEGSERAQYNRTSVSGGPDLVLASLQHAIREGLLPRIVLVERRGWWPEARGVQLRPRHAGQLPGRHRRLEVRDVAGRQYRDGICQLAVDVGARSEQLGASG